jgi:hypothetical protein
VPSTILDCTSERGRVLRRGILPVERLRDVLSGYDAEILDEGEEDAAPEDEVAVPEPDPGVETADDD